MGDDSMGGLLLGKSTPVIEHYSPELLFPISRGPARESLGFTGKLPFSGIDVWYAYELSWLDGSGHPVSKVGRFFIPADSPNLVESKSFKLYLNSLNHKTFQSDDAAINCIESDVGQVAGTVVRLQLFCPDDSALTGHALEGVCIDTGKASVGDAQPMASMIQIEKSGVIQEKLYSHLLRSLCPVTGQPDWATVWIHYRGKAINHDSLLQYIVAYRQHQEFHEQCVERMFRDILYRSEAEFLHIQAFYTRRGGLDISPFRSSEPHALPQPRLNRQ